MEFKLLDLKKHSRPITCIKFNREGDLLFSASMDLLENNILLWNPKNGELVGEYKGHLGVVKSIDVNYYSTLLISSGSDKTVRFWKVETGEEILSMAHLSMMTCCRWSNSEKYIACVQESLSDIKSCIFVYRISDELRLDRNPKNRIYNIKNMYFNKNKNLFKNKK
ncbi:translation initiation factor eIF3 subunit [Bonamia ostreae]|uniref:Serine-threonine kinase receptor-associated protein n=1 Tax=Bonamia ostreae TaxID=126728 RepID=A0ABV2ASA5_9EUKA